MISFFKNWRQVCFILCLLCLQQHVASAQRSRSMRCPKPGKEKSYDVTPPSYFEVAAGVQMSFMYHNDAAQPDDIYRFASTPGLYASAMGHLPLSARFGLLTGIQFGLNSQGISYADAGYDNAVEDYYYTGSTLVRWAFGASYYVSPSLVISAAPYVCFNSVYDNVHSTHATGQNVTIFQQSGSSTQNYDTNIYPGFSLTTNLKIYRRLYAGIQGAIDFGTSPPTQVSLAYYSNGQSTILRGKLEPRLWYAGAIISYRLFERQGS